MKLKFLPFFLWNASLRKASQIRIGQNCVKSSEGRNQCQKQQNCTFHDLYHSSQNIKEVDYETQIEFENNQEGKKSAHECNKELSTKMNIPADVHNEKKETETETLRNMKKDDQRKMLRSTLKMNLVTIALLLFLLPRHCLAIYYYRCYVTQGGCTNYLLFFNRAAFLQLCVTFTLPIIVSRLVEHIS